MKANLKVLHLVEYLELGGIERILEQFARNTLQGDANLYFYSYETEKLSGIGITLKELGNPVYFTKKSKGYDISLFKRLKEIIKRENIDVIHTHDFGPMEYALPLKIIFPKIKLIHTQHTLHHFLPNIKYTLFFQLASVFYHKVICVSHSAKKEILKRCPISRPKLIVVPNGVNTKRFDNSSEKYTTGRLEIVSISRISKEKNITFSLRALRELKDRNIPFRFHHAGSGSDDEVNKIKKCIDDLGLSKEVILYGYQDDCRKVLSKGDVFLTSSLTEGHPVSVLEAMASSKICVCSDIPPHREIDSGEFRFFKLQSIKTLTDSLESIFQKKQVYIKKANKNRKTVVEKFSLDRMIQDYVSLY